MYKDKAKQREAVRLAVRRHRAKGITKVLLNEGITQGMTETGSDTPVIPLTPTEKHVANTIEPPAQSYNPMMVGYVPPKE